MDIYVARQPIFGLDGTLYGYEFLYRSSADNQFDAHVDGSLATRSLLSNLITEFGLDMLTGGTCAFVNFTKELLDTGCPYLFSPSDFTIEILEDVRSDEALLNQLDKLRELGYTLALDDYTGDPSQDDIAALVEILKVDFRLTSREEQRQISERFSQEKKLLAEKVETEEDLEFAKENGYSLFQGYYFSRPIVLTKRVAELASATYSRLWEEIHQPEPDIAALAQIIRVDANLSYKLLTRANASVYYRGNRIKSVKSALLHMGLEEARRWILSVLMRELTGDRGDEPAKRSLVRALFMERLALEAGLKEVREDAYIVGLFSTIDLILGGGLEELVRNMNLSKEACDALLNGTGSLGDLIRFVRNYEVGNWQPLKTLIQQYNLSECDPAGLYLRAVEQAESVFGGGRKSGSTTSG